MKIESQIFRQYDIRGIVGEELDETTAEAIGKAFGTVTVRQGQKKAVVGYDNRVSSPSLKNALIKGIISTGVDVTDIGTVVTPILYYSRVLLNTTPAVMVTASHNPPQYNGFKVCSVDGGTMYGADLQNLLEIIVAGDFEVGEGKVENRQINDDYINMIIEKIKLGSKKLKVVIDCGNGTASFFAEELLLK